MAISVMPQVFEYNQHFVAMMNVINAARLNPPKEGHKHHIIPRCWFKMNNLPIDDSNNNLVLLSYEDHVKVHKLSYLCAGNREFKAKMAYAYHRLTKGQIVENGCFNGTNNPVYGKHFKRTIETCNKMSEAMKGDKNPFYGKHHSEEARRKVSEANKGKTSPMKGRTLSEETRKKISEAQRKRFVKMKENQINLRGV